MDDLKHTTIAGATGSGKSFFAGNQIESDYKRRNPILILDTKSRNHIGLSALKDMKVLQIRPGASYDWEKALKVPYLLCFPSPDMRTKALIQQYNQCLDVVYDQKKPRRLYIEEAHLFNPSAQKPDERLELFAREGRGYGIFCTFITQRIQDFPKLLWSQCGLTYLGKFNIPQDIRYVEAMIPDFSDLNTTLKKHDIVRYDHDSNAYTVIPAEQVNRITQHYG